MNRFFLLIAILSETTVSLAQNTGNISRQTDLIGRGTWQAGMQVSGGYRYSSGLDGRLIPRLHYGVKNGWSVGLEGRYQTGREPVRYVGAGLSTRYYFVRFRKLAAFGQAGVTAGQIRSRTYAADGTDPLLPVANRHEKKTRAGQVAAGLGVHVRVSNRWAIEAMAERTLTNSRDAIKNYGCWQGSAGATYRLKQK